MAKIKTQPNPVGESMVEAMADLEIPENLHEIGDQDESIEPAPEVEEDLPEPEHDTPPGEEPAAKKPSVSRVDLTTAPPEVRKLAEHLQSEFDAAMGRLNAEASKVGQLVAHKDVLAAIASNPKAIEAAIAAIRDQADPPKAIDQEVILPDRFKDVDEDTRSVIKDMLLTVREEVGRQVADIKEAMGPVQQRQWQADADRELERFNTDYPGWNQIAAPADLAQLKREWPGLPLEALFHMRAGKAMWAENRKLKGQFEKLVGGRPTPASRPQAAADVTPNVKGPADAMAAALVSLDARRRAAR